GIAHDINNMLVGILGNASMLLSITPSDHDTYPHLKEIEKSSINISELTKQLLSFAGKGKLNRKILNVDSLIGDMFDFINLSVSKKININYSLNSQNANIYGDEIQLKQIILNLVINSSESITSKGNISIHTQIINADIDFLSQFELYDNNYKPGKYLELKIEDSGMGMTKDQLERIFDPFYTTKSTGRGLGLSVVQGIIRSQNGYIHVDSIVDKGTSFKILFPINEESIIIKEEINEFAVKSFCGKWIICDDEPLVQKVSASLLNRLSIQTILVENGENLIKYFQEFSVQINGILLDLTMPGMPLMDVFFKIREIHPEIPIILMSGHADSTLIENLVNNPKVRFMQKPFTLQQLQSNLSSLLSN
ncbi:MAG: ATP-binding protein, partial [Candidatus Heimdallarchaeota archaeon]|nr:ATP-binding protein [Candidatus Heimdallarchaeota archaeon]